jgi:hypothetical protein
MDQVNAIQDVSRSFGPSYAKVPACQLDAYQTWSVQLVYVYDRS